MEHDCHVLGCRDVTLTRDQRITLRIALAAARGSELRAASRSEGVVPLSPSEVDDLDDRLW